MNQPNPASLPLENHFINQPNPATQPTHVDFVDISKKTEYVNLFERNKRAVIKPNDQTLEMFYQSFTPDSSLKILFQELEIQNDSADPNIVRLDRARHRIMKTNRELLPLKIL